MNRIRPSTSSWLVLSYRAVRMPSLRYLLFIPGMVLIVALSGVEVSYGQSAPRLAVEVKLPERPASDATGSDLSGSNLPRSRRAQPDQPTFTGSRLQFYLRETSHAHFDYVLIYRVDEQGQVALVGPVPRLPKDNDQPQGPVEVGPITKSPDFIVSDQEAGTYIFVAVNRKSSDVEMLLCTASLVHAADYLDAKPQSTIFAVKFKVEQEGNARSGFQESERVISRATFPLPHSDPITFRKATIRPTKATIKLLQSAGLISTVVFSGGVITLKVGFYLRLRAGDAGPDVGRYNLVIAPIVLEDQTQDQRRHVPFPLLIRRDGAGLIQREVTEPLARAIVERLAR